MRRADWPVARSFNARSFQVNSNRDTGLLPASNAGKLHFRTCVSVCVSCNDYTMFWFVEVGRLFLMPRQRTSL